MRDSIRQHARAWLAAVAAASAVAAAWPLGPVAEGTRARRGKTVLPEVVAAAIPDGQVAAPMPPSGYSPQTRLGFTAGDQWEPAIAADAHGHVYVLYAQYLGVPGCPTCPSPTAILQRSEDGGESWGPPGLVAPPGTGQWDPQIVVDPIDGRTVYAAWLQDGKSDVAVARSDDFGLTWSVTLADATNAGTDKPALAVRGSDVYVGYNHANKVWVSSSHDGGATFRSVNVNRNGRLGWSLAGGAAVDPAGNAYFAWAGYEQNGGAKGPVNLYISRSADGGETWASTVVDVSAAPPDCSAYLCGWAFLGAQITVAAGEDGVLYALWNAGAADRGPERIYFARSTDGGVTWTARSDVSLAPAGANHAFPAVAARGRGDVRIFWMDDRSGGWWNTYGRRSNDGGRRWSAEADLSTFVPGFDYITADGFRFPFGDYFEADVDAEGTTHVVWGEGFNYDSPGSIWYARGR